MAPHRRTTDCRGGFRRAAHRGPPAASHGSPARHRASRRAACSGKTADDGRDRIDVHDASITWSRGQHAGSRDHGHWRPRMQRRLVRRVGRIRRPASSSAALSIDPVTGGARIGQIAGRVRHRLLVSRLRQAIDAPARQRSIFGELDPLRVGDRRQPAVLAADAGREHQRRCIGQRERGVVDELPSTVDAGAPIDEREAGVRVVRRSAWRALRDRASGP